MTPLLGLSFPDWLSEYQDQVIARTQEHALLSVYVIIAATVIGLLVAICTYRSPAIAGVVVSITAVGFTLPSVSLFAILYSRFGSNLWAAVFPPLVLYALLPLMRNSIVGLQQVDAGILDAAKGIGMNRFRMLWQIELPMAWPVILAGVRISAQLTVGIVAIAAFAYPIGLGQYAYDALANLGSANRGNEAIACVLFAVIIALVFDAVLAIVRIITTPRGLRA